MLQCRKDVKEDPADPARRDAAAGYFSRHEKSPPGRSLVDGCPAGSHHKGQPKDQGRFSWRMQRLLLVSSRRVFG